MDRLSLASRRHKPFLSLHPIIISRELNSSLTSISNLMITDSSGKAVVVGELQPKWGDQFITDAERKK